MIRVLVMVAVTGFLVSVVTLSTAVALAGPDAIAKGAWSWGPDGWGSDGDGFNIGYDGDRRGGPHGTREIAWTGGDTLDVDVPAEISYTQAPGPGKLTVSGPQRALDNLVIEDGHLRFAHGRHHGSDLTIVMTAPGVTHFDLRGSNRLSIEGYKQDKLSLDVSGNAEVSAKGEAKAVALSISGSGETDLAGFKVADADVDIDGSGQATLAPTGAANVNISGSGDVTLLSHPAKLESNVSGSGSIHQKDGAAQADPAPPTPPTPPARHGRRT